MLEIGLAVEEPKARRRRSNPIVQTNGVLTSDANIEIGPEAETPKVRRKSSISFVKAIPILNSSAPIPPVTDDAEQRGAIDDVSAGQILPLAATIAELRELQAQRKFCIKAKIKMHNMATSYIATGMGYVPPKIKQKDNDSKENEESKKIWKKAQAERTRIANKFCVEDAELRSLMIMGASQKELLVINSNDSAKPWEALRDKTEKRMEELAKQLPAWEFVQGVRGFGARGFAIVIGETGDLSNYATKEKVWKRLGLAVMDGFRQGDSKRPDTSAQSWTDHGYNPERRAEIWTIAESLFRAQRRGEKDVDGVVTPAHSLGPYGDVYATRKAATESREWSPKRRDNDARRIMTKALIKDLWRAWRAAIIAVGAVAIMPPAEAIH